MLWPAQQKPMYVTYRIKDDCFLAQFAVELTGNGQSEQSMKEERNHYYYFFNLQNNIHLSKWGMEKTIKLSAFLHELSKDQPTSEQLDHVSGDHLHPDVKPFREVSEATKKHKMYCKLVLKKNILLIALWEKHPIQKLYTNEREHKNEQSLNISLFNTMLCFYIIKVIQI